MVFNIIPNKAGIGLRSEHHQEVLENKPDVAWWEIHTENFFAEGGRQLAFLEKIANTYPLSFHGVGLSLGSADGISKEHLQQIKLLVNRINPGLVSEHISWSAFHGEYLNDLLPLPYNKESLDIISDNINKTQDYLGRQILVENPSTYTQFKSSNMSEEEFILRIVDKTSCGLLLDINNIYVSGQNLGFDIKEYIDIVAEKASGIHEIHLAGHSVVHKGNFTLRVDTHSDKVCNDVWQLFEYTISKIGVKPALIEWDEDIPDLAVLQKEANLAEKMLERNKSKVE